MAALQRTSAELLQKSTLVLQKGTLAEAKVKVLEATLNETVQAMNETVISTEQIQARGEAMVNGAREQTDAAVAVAEQAFKALQAAKAEVAWLSGLTDEEATASLTGPDAPERVITRTAPQADTGAEDAGVAGTLARGARSLLDVYNDMGGSWSRQDKKDRKAREKRNRQQRRQD